MSFLDRFYSILLLLSLAVWPIVTPGMAPAQTRDATLPSDTTIRAATALCRPGTAAPPRNIVGISDPHARDPRVIDIIAETGVRWVRAEFHWSVVQPDGRGPMNWEPYDAMVQRYRQHGINVAAILTYIPESLNDWATIDAGFQRFAAEAVARYAPRGVHVWEVFNEPNLTGYGWLSHDDDARRYFGAYALLLARANAAVRAHDPNGVVVIGGLAGEGHRPVSPEETMDVLYGLGVQDCFDVMAYHPYGYQARFAEARARIDRIMAQHDDLAKPIWFNEYGWTDHEAMSLSVNRSESTNPMIATFAQRHHADALFWFAARDYSGRFTAPTFGLVTYDFEKRDSFETFQVIIDAIDAQR
jgi:hypothetical protein